MSSIITLTLATLSGFDINDVSVLFPNDGRHFPVPHMTLEWSSAIEAQTLDSVLAHGAKIGISAPQTTRMSSASDWAIRAFRVDPCAPPSLKRGRTATCLFELRLIAQPTARFSPADSALHLTYLIDTREPNAAHELVKDLTTLKIESEKESGASTDRAPLGIHPGLKKAFVEKNSVVPNLFSAFLQKHVKKEQLSTITMMGLRGGAPTDWIFFGGDVRGGKWFVTPVPNRKNQASPAQVFEPFVELSVMDGSESFKGEAVDPLFSLDRFFNASEGLDDETIASVGETTFLLENPELSNRNTVDCVSCHAATTTRVASEWAFPKNLPGITAEAERGITNFPAIETLPNHPLHWNLRAFGYFGLQPTVSLRTVHESARAAARLNEISGRVGPGVDCTKASTEVMQCLIESTLIPGSKSSSDECLSLCQSSNRRAPK